MACLPWLAPEGRAALRVEPFDLSRMDAATPVRVRAMRGFLDRHARGSAAMPEWALEILRRHAAADDLVSLGEGADAGAERRQKTTRTPPTHDPLGIEDLARLVQAKVREVSDLEVVGTVERVHVTRTGSYFELRGGHAAINCVAWASSRVEVLAGEVCVHVKRVDFYAPQGRCQAIVTALRKVADPSLSPKQALLEALREEGVLDRPRKPLPAVVSHLCLVTSAGSAAHADMLAGVHARWPGLRTTTVHTAVQGEAAPAAIAAALRRADALGADVIVCGRGGGSAADLAAFDAEPVACPRRRARARGQRRGARGRPQRRRRRRRRRAKTPTAAIELVLALSRDDAHACLARATARAPTRRSHTCASEREGARAGCARAPRRG